MAVKFETVKSGDTLYSVFRRGVGHTTMRETVSLPVKVLAIDESGEGARVSMNGNQAVWRSRAAIEKLRRTPYTKPVRRALRVQALGALPEGRRPTGTAVARPAGVPALVANHRDDRPATGRPAPDDQTMTTEGARMTTTTEPTLTEIAAELEQHRAAIAGHRDRITETRATADQRVREAEAVIADHERQARELIKRHEQMVRATFGGLFTEPEAKPKRVRNGNGAPNPAYADRTAKRLATLAANKEEARARAYAKERGLHCPDDAPVPDEVMAAFRQEGGFQG